MAIVAILIVVAHLTLAVYFSIRVMNTGLLTKKQKLINVPLLFIFPFVWCILIFYLLKRQPGSHEIAIKNDVSTNGYHESGIAINNH